MLYGALSTLTFGHTWGGMDGLPHYHPIYGVVPFFDGLGLYLPEVRAGFGAAHRVASDRHYVMLLVLLCLWKLWNCEL